MTKKFHRDILKRLFAMDSSEYTITLIVATQTFSGMFSGLIIEKMEKVEINKQTVERITFDDDDKICCSTDLESILSIEQEDDDADHYNITVGNLV